jgi:disulfide bond formation protein DsbB
MTNNKSKKILTLLFFTSVIALVSAYIAQFVFDYQPCILCLYQRAPFFLIAAISALVLFFKNKKLRGAVIFCCMILLLINSAIAAYQVGVEKKIFKGPATCSSKNLESITDLKELKIALMRTRAVRCDEPEFFFLTLSMATWNMLYCGFLFFLTAFYRRRRA